MVPLRWVERLFRGLINLLGPEKYLPGPVESCCGVVQRHYVARGTLGSVETDPRVPGEEGKEKSDNQVQDVLT